MPQHRVLVIGVGSIGERHLRCFGQTGRATMSLCEINDDLRQTIADRYSIDNAYADLDAAMADEHDAAVIAVPAQLHVPFATKLAEAGLHLLIEKPLSASLDGLDAMQDAIARSKVAAMVAYVFRSIDWVIDAREALNSGRFGRPLHLYATAGQHFPTFRPAYRDTYYNDRATGGGVIQDALTHVINTGEWLVGPIDRLAAIAGHQALDGVDVEDTVNVITDHGGVLGSYGYNQYQAPNEVAITVVCEDGTVRIEQHASRWRWMTDPDPGNDWHDVQFEPAERDTFFVKQANTFLDVIEGKQTPPCTVDEGIQTLRVNLALMRAADESVWQTIER